MTGDTSWTLQAWLNLDGLRCCFCQALAEALKVNSSIANIKLDNNSIYGEGAKAWHLLVSLHHEAMPMIQIRSCLVSSDSLLKIFRIESEGLDPSKLVDSVTSARPWPRL